MAEKTRGPIYQNENINAVIEKNKSTIYIKIKINTDDQHCNQYSPKKERKNKRTMQPSFTSKGK